MASSAVGAVLLGVSLLGLTMISSHPAGAEERMELLTTATWLQLDEATRLWYAKATVDTLGAVGNFTCTRPVSIALATAKLRARALTAPDDVHTRFVAALMDALTREHHCRFLDVDRLKFLNQKLEEWERAARR